MTILFWLLFLRMAPQNLPPQTPEVFFTIQVAAPGKVLPENHALFQAFKDARTIPMPDHITRYFVGTFETFHEAKNYLDQEVKPKGYKDAYVVAFHQGRRISVDEAISIIYR